MNKFDSENSSRTLLADVRHYSAQTLASADRLRSVAYRHLRRRRYMVLLCAAAGGMLGFYRSDHSANRYASSTEVRLEPAESSHLALVYSGSLKRPHLEIASEAQKLKSNNVLLQVAQELNLANDPRFLAAHPGPPRNLDQPEVRAEVLAHLRGGLSLSYSDKVEDESDPFASPDEASTAQPKKKTRDDQPHLLTITYVGSDPVLAAAIVSHISSVYAAWTYKLRYEAMMRVASRLSPAMEGLRSELETEQRRLMQLEQNAGILGGAADSPINAPLPGLLKSANQANGKTRRARALAQSAHETGALDVASPRLDVARLERQVDEAKRQEAELSVALGPSHPALIELRSRMQSLEKSVAEINQQRALAASSQLRMAEAEADQVYAEFLTQMKKAHQDGDSASQIALSRVRVRRDSELYWVLMNNVKTAAIDAGYGGVRVDTLRAAEISSEPLDKAVALTTATDAAAGLLAGVILAALLALFRDERLMTIEAIESTLELPAYGVIPWSSSPGGPDATQSAQMDRGAFIDAIHGLESSLLFTSASSAPRTIVFTSAIAGQGRTTIALEIARSLARSGARVLLVDADLRRPMLHRRLGLNGQRGLTTVLSGMATFDDVVERSIDGTSLDVLTSGPLPPASRGLLHSSGAAEVLRHAVASYRYVIFDIAPVLPMTDDIFFMQQVDAVLLIARHKGLRRKSLRGCRDVLVRTGVPLVGFVLNGVGAVKQNR